LESIESHVEEIRKQEITQIFYLPKGCYLQNESIVFLDRIISCKLDKELYEAKAVRKIFTLSDYGFYMFLIKLSIHFTRLGEKIIRGPI
jgi:hypothetical protein